MTCDRCCEISTHAPTRGATEIVYKRRMGNTFQPTLPRGERRGSDQHAGLPAHISTHAPTRGATTHSPKHRWCTRYFNPRSHAGSDIRDAIIRDAIPKFQPTLPRGERHQSCTKNAIVITFYISKITLLQDGL